jgi:hypothetical protein
MRHILLILIFVASSCQLTEGGGGSHSGREPRIWENTSVIVGTFKDIKKLKAPGDDLYSATLVPKATLAGAFDPSLNPMLHVRFFASVLNASISRVPSEGDTIIAVIHIGLIQRDEVEPSDWISGLGWEFMPDSQALVVIKRLDDPKVGETLKKIQEARAHPDPDPDAPRPGNKPAAPTKSK